MSYADDWWVRVRSYEFCTKATACDCDACVRLKKAAQQIDDLTWWTDDDAADAIARAQLAIAEARETLHELHAADRRSVMRYGRHLEDVPRGELYIRSEKDDHEEFGEDYESVEEDDSESESGFGSRCNCSEQDEYWEHLRDDKFMVCDHCHAHGLRCDEDAVCLQCELADTPCIHRLCRISPSSKERCTNPSCRYAHRDYLRATEGYEESDYIILPGNLRRYLSSGKLPSFRRPLGHRDYMQVTSEGKRRQKMAREELNRAVRDGEASLENLHFPCGDICGKRMVAEEESVGSDESDDEVYRG